MGKQQRRFSAWMPLLITLCVLGAVAIWVGREYRLRSSRAPRRRDVRRAHIVRDVVLGPKKRAVPGKIRTATLFYEHPGVTNVTVSGSWDKWKTPRPMELRGRQWVFNVKDLSLPLGRYEFKFLPDGEWEPGANRALYVNDDGLLQRPLDIIFTARLEEPDRIDVVFKTLPPGAAADAVPAGLQVRLSPHVPIENVSWVPGRGKREHFGYHVSGGFVTFCMDEMYYKVAVPRTARVTVAGTFNGWNAGGMAPWVLKDEDDDGRWEGTFALPVTHEKDLQFKFVVNGKRWLMPPYGTPNVVEDEDGNRNLRIDRAISRSPALRITTQKPASLSTTYTLVVDGLGDRPAYHVLTPGDFVDKMVSREPMGATADPVRRETTYRLFAPRARSVDLCLYGGPVHTRGDSTPQPVRPSEIVSMTPDPVRGTWEAVLNGFHAGRYYSFRIDGPAGPGEGFNVREQVGDPYARAVAHAANNSIVIDPRATNRWFGGWTDTDYKPPAWEDVVIYEAHVRDLTIDASSGVPELLRGRYEGILASQGTGTGLDHLKKLGVNMIELLPVGEFENGEFEHNWGYSTAFFFAPEASYGRAPLEGSQYYEFKHLVNELHRRGFGVILDVVYNHIGGPNPFYLLDRKYYFRQDQDFKLTNFSGCGNDVRTEAPMMRRLIIDNVLYWMEEFHVDGFRFDLAELIDMETLMAVRNAARAANPNVLLISEPWSFRGDHKYDLTGTGWAAWNNEFRDAAKNFVRGHANRDDLKRAVRGSVEAWTVNPMQSVNYLESHDDMTLADELSSDPRHDARNMHAADAARNRLAATILFTSLGIPMLTEGQEFLRSKHGIHNSFASGDKVNAIRWGDRDLPEPAAALAYCAGMLHLRNSSPGAAFRWPAKEVPEGYYKWIEPRNGRSLGYIVNAGHGQRGGCFVVLLNAGPSPVTFRVPFPEGSWRLVADGRSVDVLGLQAEFEEDGVTRPTIEVPAVSSRVFMSLPEI